MPQSPEVHTYPSLTNYFLFWKKCSWEPRKGKDVYAYDMLYIFFFNLTSNLYFLLDVFSFLYHLALYYFPRTLFNRHNVNCILSAIKFSWQNHCNLLSTIPPKASFLSVFVGLDLSLLIKLTSVLLPAVLWLQSLCFKLKKFNAT